MRRTAQRSMVYEAIVRLGGHCTADQITEELRRTKPTFPRSTVYRGLEALTAAGSLYAAHLGEGATPELPLRRAVSDLQGGTMESKIVGTVMPVLEMSMQPGDKVFAESGQLAWMSMAMQMQTSTSAGGQQGGFLGALGRAVAGGTLFMTEYTAVGGPGLLSFAAKLPGEILPLEGAPY